MLRSTITHEIREIGGIPKERCNEIYRIFSEANKKTPGFMAPSNSFKSGRMAENDNQDGSLVRINVQVPVGSFDEIWKRIEEICK